MTGLVDPETSEYVASTDTANFESAHGQPLKDDDTGSLDELLTPVESEDAPSEPEGADEADDIPEKYRGKSLKDVIEMHQNAERRMGQQSSEVGELRQVVDTFIQAQMAATQTAVDDDEEVDFLVEPEKAISKAIEKHPALKEAKQATETMRRESAITRLKEAHPDYSEILADPGFAEYVKASKVRMALYRQADVEHDFDAADELLSSYKERKSIVQQTVEADKQSREGAIKAASTGGAPASTSAPSKKIFRRADIIKLMQTDPKRYEALQDEILAAYREKRVR